MYGELVDISRLVKPSYYEQAFSNLKAAHSDDHAKGRAFKKKLRLFTITFHRESVR